MDEQHKKVLRLLGFEMRDISSSVRPKHYLQLRRGDKTYKNGVGHDKSLTFTRVIVYGGDVLSADARAWSQAPSPESLLLPLILSMTTERLSFDINLLSDGEYNGGITDWWVGGSVAEWAVEVDNQPTYLAALFALFIAACEGSLIAPATVVLP